MGAKKEEKQNNSNSTTNLDRRGINSKWGAGYTRTDPPNTQSSLGEKQNEVYSVTREKRKKTTLLSTNSLRVSTGRCNSSSSVMQNFGSFLSEVFRSYWR
jgi:hypothetical protein